MSIHSPPSPHQRDPSRLTRQRFDALIIGGGINGAGIARDLALRGVRVALVEKEDFASGTSSASTKLVHGGLRYLERFDFRLVFESCRERRILQTIAPHLVRPLPFFIPVYKGDPRSLLTIRAGMTLYDLLALFRNTGRHTILSADETLRSEPALQGEGLVGAARYWDCRMDDARLCLENILAAAEAGAEVFNYMTLTSLLKRGGKVCGARLRDGIDGQEREVEATVIINATGPWLDRLCALDGDDAAKLRTTRGTHILVPRINCGDEALYLTAGRDDRLFFVIPWGELSLIGTTDVDDRRDPDNLTPTEDDIAYLLGEAKRHLRTPELKRDDIVSSFAGLRPLVAEEESKATRTSREHRLFTSASGLLSVGGGKYTTYRAVAEEVSSRVMELLGRPRGPSLTGSTPLPGGATGDFRRYLATQVPLWRSACDLPRERLEGLADLYGSRTPRLLAMADAEPDLLYPIVAGSPLLALQVAYAVDFEGARTPEDILRRRTPLALLPGRGLAELPAVAEIMASRLGIDRDRRQEWENSYRKRYLTP
ncbi:glycerol-3-phosphate dehydrogenase [Desulfuromonas soudanensis]|uniref:Glycerol-3-phosphate dehydrogenase n=1 Tax=Desulfuromonas soudanensis TaxID=1603606 RepID=A0A0M4DKM8_9BACT|nr:glycerol-3-phosphate dehydrogenase [Desulfuromonas soudanensis]ALC18112.1 glycerol-3-phosphate dehydrogenase [Desulfuromonas soudanensis]